MNNPPAKNAEEIRDDAEARDRNQSCQILRCEHKLDRLQRHDAERIEFLRDFHGPDFSRECRAGSSADGNRREQWAEFAREADRDQVNDVLHSSKAAQFRRSLHRENESSADRHQRDHGHCIDAAFQHLLHGSLPTVTISYKGQRSSHGPQCGPKLNIQTSDVIEMCDCFFTDVFENIGHQETFCPQSLASNRASTPVTSNSRSTGPPSPCKQNIVWRWRAILRASTKVAIPDVSM